MKILLLNAGSSSLKAALVDANGTPFAQGLAEWSGPATYYEYAPASGAKISEEVPWNGHSEAVERFVFDLMRESPTLLTDRSSLAAVGHRVVHGGRFTSAVRISSGIRAEISALAHLAPLHNPPSLETLAAAERALPDVPQVAVFDTAFHSTLSEVAWTYPVPASWTREWGIRRYGFHGLSLAYCSRRAAELLGRAQRFAYPWRPDYDRIGALRADAPGRTDCIVIQDGVMPCYPVDEPA